MPEGPELHVSGWFVDRFSEGRIYTGKVVKSEVSLKNPDIDWDVPNYTIKTTTRGKEIMLTLIEVDGDEEAVKNSKKKAKSQSSKDTLKKQTTIRFNFGMTGKFVFSQKDELDKHCHLNFFSRDDDMVLSFNDYRRFGRWEQTEKWGKDRGPCVILEYELFRKNVLENLQGSQLEKPICEVLHNQKYFNGIGNYLRAEILYRAGIPPFKSTQSVLDPIREADEAGVKTEDNDLLKLCHTVPTEVINLKGGLRYIYDPRNKGESDISTFMNWLQCYYKDGMSNLVDHQGRTIWFSGPAGPLKPTGAKSREKNAKWSKKEKRYAEKPEKEDQPSKAKRVKKEPKKEEEEEKTSTKTTKSKKTKSGKTTRRSVAKNKPVKDTPVKSEKKSKKTPAKNKQEKERPKGSRVQPRRSCTRTQA